MSLYLVPATRDNLEVSIEMEVAPERLAPHVSKDIFEELLRLGGPEGIRCWAMTTTLRAAFDAMRPGDLVLLSESDTKRFTHCAQVTSKVESKAFGDALWPVKGDKSWELIYFLRNIRQISVSKAELVEKLGYAPNFAVPGTTHVKDDRIQRFESKHGPIANWLGILYDRAEYTDALGELRDGELADYSAENVLVAAKRRRQHKVFADKVKTNYGMSCAMCGIAEQVFLVAGHIVPWAEDEQNRLNPANGLCLCVMHDRAFEQGYLFLDDGLHIRMNPHRSMTSPLSQQLKPLEGQRIRTPKANPPDKLLLKRHRDRFLPQG
jgi:putative restriction endonuclease